MRNNPFYSYLYKIVISSYGKKTILARIVGKLYELLCVIKKDTPISLQLNNQPFCFPFSHKLLLYQKVFPLYDRHLSKLCFYMRDILGGKINVIDVGANVGDTVVNIGLKDAFYLCIEGDDFYSNYIQYNLKEYDYALETVFLSDVNEETSYRIEAQNGTGHLAKSKDKCACVRLITLDKLLEDKYPLLKIDLLKIDTDGFDYKVIRGSKDMIRRFHPLIFFEWDEGAWGKQNENASDVFPMLNKMGYTKCVLFDNLGNLIDIVLSIDKSSIQSYIGKTREHGPISYYDVLAVPANSFFRADQLFAFFQ